MDVRFITSSPDLRGRPEHVLPEFAFIGRSNCGKSSLINHFLGRAKLAKTSGKPGKTRLLNYFLVDERYYLVDLPGYGFARVSKDVRARWKTLFQEFLKAQDRPLAIFHLMDARHKPTREDREYADLIRRSGHPGAVAVTKIDKVGTNSLPARYQEIIQTLELTAEIPFFPTSSRQRVGREDMLLWVETLLDAYTQQDARGGGEGRI
ncbi:YihA family ribosome biogenesis GTP-binding protein [bacterium DOLJORAL78_65_58]|nr:MAG: YihA family ribosome biogenesis GTP-binding protein [bacterium DOLJORAL78_65_58]